MINWCEASKESQNVKKRERTPKNDTEIGQIQESTLE